ncbi:hypothetical protein ABIE18_003843 [Arthrobacter sp. 2762]|jgi:hypothetical protein
MMLLKTLNFFLDASSSHSGSSGASPEENTPAATFASERLSSSAWEGWWDDADQGFPAGA